MAGGRSQRSGGRVSNRVTIVRPLICKAYNGTFGCVVPCGRGDDSSSRTIGRFVVKFAVYGYDEEESILRSGFVG